MRLLFNSISALALISSPSHAFIVSPSSTKTSVTTAPFTTNPTNSVHDDSVFGRNPTKSESRVSPLRMESLAGMGNPTELPDSLEDSAIIAATACQEFSTHAGTPSRCRIDFDTSVGDETYTTLKSSTEFMQKFVSAVSYAMIPGLMEQRQQQMMKVVQARAELQQLMVQTTEMDFETVEKNKEALMAIIQSGGKDPSDTEEEYNGPVVRIYFPDEGNAALARRDWTQIDPETNEALVPSCVQFSSLGGVQLQDTSKDELIFFFCPKASESDSVEEILYECEASCPNLKLSIFVNPLLVDMGVTGFGMAGRMLRERLIDPLVNVYYLRTLQWGALTRLWPREFTVWQEDEYAEGGYRMIKSLDTLPSNPEVEDIYDIENGIMKENKEGFGLLNALGDFVNGMTQL